jgi:hypothetical protein
LCPHPTTHPDFLSVERCCFTQETQARVVWIINLYPSLSTVLVADGGFKPQARVFLAHLRTKPDDTTVIRDELPALGENEIRMNVDKVGLSANNRWTRI